MSNLRIGIDASNIRDGGGLGHLREVLRVARPEEHGIGRIVVWAERQTLDQLPTQPWLVLQHDPQLDQGLLSRLRWQVRTLPRLAQEHCDCLYVPGGLYLGSFKPFVLLSQNMLPFEWNESRRYGWSALTLKFWLLRWGQIRSFRQAEGAFFLSDYARSVIQQMAGLSGRYPIIPLGVNQEFFCAPREQRPLTEYSFARPFRLLYVSKLEPYKHHTKVIEAVAQLRREGLPVSLELIGGPERQNVWQAVESARQQADAKGEFIHYSGYCPYEQLVARYHQTDAFVFASSCENLPTILLEAMAAGLPIACAERGPMPETLGQAGRYFDPEQPTSIAEAVRQLLCDHEWRTQAARAAYEQSQAYSWERCAQNTLMFLAEIVRRTQLPQTIPATALPELDRLSSSAK